MTRAPVASCPACGYRGRLRPFGRTAKQLLFRASLWLLALLPGYLYDLAIRDRYVCPRCRAEVPTGGGLSAERS
ncbi:MAG TPA: hypothetical protein VNM66_09795 [Thermodesulfobacteriota bacterium]|nr:hypothetical protein [Thermodesulfobacteriota bacterium]